MHIADGVVSPPILIAATGLSLAGAAYGLRRLDYEKIPMAGLLGSAFFVVCLARMPIGPSSVHLILNGLVGLILGPAAVPVIMVALILQALFWGFGGITAIGVNTMVLAAPALLCYYLFNWIIMKTNSPRMLMGAGMLTGVVSVGLTSILAAAALYLSGDSFFYTAIALLAAHAPLMAVEGVMTGLLVVYLKKSNPAVFAALSKGGERHKIRRQVTAGGLSGALVAAALAFPVSEAAAHNLRVFAADKGDAIEGYAFFNPSRKLSNVDVQVVGDDGKTLSTIKPDAAGVFRFVPESSGRYRFLVETTGHRGEMAVSFHRPAPPSASPPTTATQEPPPPPPELRPAVTAETRIHPGQPAAAIDHRAIEGEIRRIIAEENARQSYAILEKLRKIEEKTQFRDILGGVGFLLGLLGIYAYYLGGKRGVL